MGIQEKGAGPGVVNITEAESGQWLPGAGGVATGWELVSDGDGISHVQDGKLSARGFTARKGVNPAELSPENW